MHQKSKTKRRAARKALEVKQGTLKKTALKGAARILYESMSTSQLKDLAKPK